MNQNDDHQSPVSGRQRFADWIRKENAVHGFARDIRDGTTVYFSDELAACYDLMVQGPDARHVIIEFEHAGLGEGFVEAAMRVWVEKMGAEWWYIANDLQWIIVADGEGWKKYGPDDLIQAGPVDFEFRLSQVPVPPALQPDPVQSSEQPATVDSEFRLSQVPVPPASQQDPIESSDEPAPSASPMDLSTNRLSGFFYSRSSLLVALSLTLLTFGYLFLVMMEMGKCFEVPGSTPRTLGTSFGLSHEVVTGYMRLRTTDMLACYREFNTIWDNIFPVLYGFMYVFWLALIFQPYRHKMGMLILLPFLQTVFDWLENFQLVQATNSFLLNQEIDPGTVQWASAFSMAKWGISMLVFAMILGGIVWRIGAARRSR